VLFIINDHPSAHKHNNKNILIFLSKGLLVPKAINTISRKTRIRKNDAGEHKFSIVEYIYYYKKYIYFV
jgi:hypothetical protein